MRWGFAARGVAYVIVAWFALAAALGYGRPEDARNAFVEVLWMPFGPLVLAALAIGFAGHGVWRVTQAVLDVERHGRDVRGATLRAAQLAGAGLALSLGGFAAMLALGQRQPDPAQQRDEARDWVLWLLLQPLGRWAVAAIGLAVLGTAAGQLWGAWSASFCRNLDGNPATLRVVRLIGRIGLVANAAVLGAVGIFFVNAAWWADWSESGGILTVLETLWRTEAGPWLLGVVALGMLAFGLFSFALARYRRIEAPLSTRLARARAGSKSSGKNG
jgi:hypothetical protein